MMTGRLLFSGHRMRSAVTAANRRFQPGCRADVSVYCSGCHGLLLDRINAADSAVFIANTFGSLAPPGYHAVEVLARCL